LWCGQTHFCLSQCDTDIVQIPRALVQRLTEAICYAA
jgi:hypothetical protein